MICPKCGDEYKEGVNVCAGCNVPLVEKKEKEKRQEGETEPVNMVTILKNADPSAIAILESLLEDAGIEYYVSSREFSSVYGVHGLHGFEPVSLLTGTMTIQVERKNVEKAMELVNQLNEYRQNND